LVFGIAPVDDPGGELNVIEIDPLIGVLHGKSGTWWRIPKAKVDVRTAVSYWWQIASAAARCQNILVP
jgi:hypothetical protein